MSKHVLHSRKLVDWHLWAEVRRTVTPLRRQAEEIFVEAALPIPALKPPPVFRKGAGWAGPALPSYQPPISTQPPSAADHLLEPRLKRRLRRGQIDIDATIDLHGMRQHEAREALQRFVPARAARGDRTILVITGKGLRQAEGVYGTERGVLRAMLPAWLGEPGLSPYIAGWDVAAQPHGGAGAFYVRLRHPR
jgi:DNA-nicking Smr family endonuclease